MKNCPFCKAEIPVDALKCKHCGEWVDGRTVQDSGDREKIVNIRWQASDAQVKAFKGQFIWFTITSLIMFALFIGLFFFILPEWHRKERDEFRKRTEWPQQESPNR